VSLFERFSRIVALITACVVPVLAPAGLAAQAPIAPEQAASIFDASDLRKPVPVDGPWLVQGGDSPVNPGGGLAWADPHFDDSHWMRFNAKTGSLNELFPHDHPEVVWYRIHIKAASHDTDLALLEYTLSSAFEIYANGVLILRSGSVAPYIPYDYNARMIAHIPAGQIASGSVVLAVRVRINPTEWNNPSPGLAAENLTLGQQNALENQRWLGVIGRNALHWIFDLLSMALALGGLLLYSAQRRREYLYLALWSMGYLVSLPLDVYGYFHAYSWQWGLLSGIGTAFTVFLYPRLYLSFIGRRVGPKLNVYALIAASLWLALYLLGFRSFWSAALAVLALVLFAILLSVILPVLLIAEVRRGNRDAAILLLPLFLSGLYYDMAFVVISLLLIPALRSSVDPVLSGMSGFLAGPFFISIEWTFDILASLSLALIILLRSNRQSRQQAILENEIASAREVQQVILPDAVEPVPGFRVESVYEPAQEVGGDFFQTISDGAGGMIVVVGDVSGKGMPAAMLVSMLVGAIRSVAESTCEPDAILAHLNRRLIGRVKGGFSTAVAAHIFASGAVTIANAGHLAPYLDGRELELPGALPLGVDANAAYASHTFTLAPGNRLVFYSDGVVEAQNTKGELLGFERAAELSTKQATDIAAAAKRYGQSDDITVVAIAWQGAPIRHEPVAPGGIRERSLYPASTR
jgi:phosphoserine phosphatase RsbU/P